MTEQRRPARRKKRRHPAAVSRVAIAGAASTATFAIVALLGGAASSDAGPAVSTVNVQQRVAPPVAATAVPPGVAVNDGVVVRPVAPVTVPPRRVVVVRSRAS